MKLSLTIEWRHYEKEGQTCDRCSTTGKSVKEVVAALTTELAGQEVSITFIETPLPKEQMPESNLILLNGIPLEEILAEAEASESHCASCSCLTGTDTSCRTIEYNGNTYEEIPKELIRKGVYTVLKIEIPC